MKLRKYLLIGFAGVHLILVACGAFKVRPLQTVMALTGAESQYGFFAPGVGLQSQVRFIMTDASGNTWTDTIEVGANKEANLRFTGFSSRLPQDEELLFRITESYAAFMFKRHPTATNVAVRLELFGFDRNEEETDYPTLGEYRAGARPRWLPLQETTFYREDLVADVQVRP